MTVYSSLPFMTALFKMNVTRLGIGSQKTKNKCT